MSWAVTAVVTTTVISAGVSIYSGQQAAEAEESAALARAQAERDAAERAQEVAAENARRREKEAARMVAEQRAALAASGLAMTGTPLAVLGENYQQAQQDVADLRYQTAMRTRSAEYSAGLSLAEGSNAADARILQGYAGAVQSVASGASFLAQQ